MNRCPECGFHFYDSADHRTEHRRYHDESLHGVKADPKSGEVVLWTTGADRIVLVTAHSSVWRRRRASRVASVANREMGYDFGIFSTLEPPDERDIHLYLYGRESRFVGLAVLERRTEINRCSWSSPEPGEPVATAPPGLWTVGFVWTLKVHRQSGIAKRLLATAMSDLGVTTERMAWYPPLSDDGMLLVRKLCPEGFLIGH